jgi:hypothetical protein
VKKSLDYGIAVAITTVKSFILSVPEDFNVIMDLMTNKFWSILTAREIKNVGTE